MNVIRPFGSASVDGFDIAFEHDVPNAVAFGKALREHIDQRNKENRTPN